MSDTLNVSVIFATYNRSDVIRDVLNTWREVHKNTRYSYEIICSDDASSDNTVEIIEEFTDLPITILRNEHGGASRARNAALKIAKGEIVIFTGDDIFPDMDFVNHHYENHLKFGDKICTLGRIEWHKDIKMNHLMYHITNIGCEQFGFAGLPPYSLTDFRHFYTSNISVSKKELDSLDKHFDLTFDKYGFEDIELGYRLFENGVRIFYDPDLVAYHHHIYADVDKFCNRQNSAGDQMVVFSRLHDKVRHNEAMGIYKFENALDDYIAHCDEKVSSRGEAIISHMDEMKARTRELERLIETEDDRRYRAECSALYRMIFQFAMYMGWAKRLVKDKGIDDSIIAEAAYNYMYPCDSQMFIPTNGQYSEEESVRFDNRQITHKVKKSISNLSALRFDPSNEPCIVKNVVAVAEDSKGNIKKLKIKSTNGKGKNKLNFLHTEDSQIHFSGLDGHKSYTVKLKMEIISKVDINKNTKRLIEEELATDRDYKSSIYQKPNFNICVLYGDTKRKIADDLRILLSIIYQGRVTVSDEICEKEFCSNYVYQMNDMSISYEDILLAVRDIFQHNIEGVRLDNGDCIYMNILCEQDREKLKTYKYMERE